MLSAQSWMPKIVRRFFSGKSAVRLDDTWLYNMLDLLPKPFFLLDFKEKRITYSNAAARRILGMDYEQNPASISYGKKFSLFGPDGKVIPAENLPSARVLQGEKIDGEDFLLKSLAGDFSIRVFSENIPAMSGRPASALIVFQDLTSLKETEDSLRRTQAELNEAVEIAQLGFWSVDKVTKKTTVSPQLLEQFGLTDEIDADLNRFLGVIHADDRPRVIQAIEDSLNNGTAYHIEYRVVHSSGAIRWIEARSGRSDVRNVDATRFSGTTLDITDRIKAKEDIETKERDLRRLADSMPQIVWSANSSGDLDYFNQVWFDYSGSTYQENEGAGWSKFVHPDDLPHTIKNWQKALAGTVSYENEFRLRRKDGHYRWHYARARPICGTDGSVVKWYGTNTDVHDQKLLAEKLDEARAAAERANSAKSQFLANMSHEIRTPLGAIMGFSELIKDPKLGRFEREEYISVIERNSAQLMRIVDDILDLSKVEAGMMLIENIQFSLPEALTEFSSLMEFKAQEKGITFRSKATTPLPSTIICDPTRLRQILMNVVGNAIKFTDEGHVELRVGYSEGHLDFEIEDTGRGISSEQEVQLFKPFTQADASTTRQYGGTGLGLALTRNLAEALGGHFILKKSEVGRGSVFAFRIKAKAPTDTKVFSGFGFDSDPVRSAAPLGKLSDVRILLVEDSPDNQALISIFLNRAGARVDIASDGEQGVSMALAGEYEVVLMDVQMPVMDGLSAVKALRSKDYQKPIVALTAHAMKEERDRCLGAGFSDFISKPVNREDLVNKILAHRRQPACL